MTSAVVGPARHDAGAPERSQREVGLDVVRGAAVAWLLVDHLAATASGVWGWGWLYWVRMFDRPSLPLFMVVSGTLVYSHRSRPQLLRHQAARVLPWAVAATVCAAEVPRFDFPEPLTIYLLALRCSGCSGVGSGWAPVCACWSH